MSIIDFRPSRVFSVLGDVEPSGSETFPDSMAYTMYLNDSVNFPFQVFTTTLDGVNDSALWFPTLTCVHPTFSPDYQTIFFQGSPAATGVGSFLYLCNPDGSDLLKSTLYGVNMPSWHPNSSKIIFVKSATLEIHTINRDGSSDTVLYTHPSGTIANASYNFDGTKIAFVNTVAGVCSLWVMNSDGTGATQIKTPVTTDTEYNYCWANLSNRIVYQSTTASELRVINSDGTGDIQIASPPGGGVSYSPIRKKCWLPDDSKIINTKFATTIWQLWGINSDGSGNAAFTSTGTDGTGIGLMGPAVLGNRVYFIKLVPTPSTYRRLFSVNTSGADERFEMLQGVSGFRFGPN